MKRLQILKLAAITGVLFTGISSYVQAAGGFGTIKLGYVFLDTVGNQSTDYRTYNVYDGPFLSLEGFSYNFKDGTRAGFNGRNLTMNNRNLEGTISKPRLFGLTINNAQYRRIYSFNGDKFTRRRNTGVSGYFSPLANVQFYGGGAWVNYHGDQIPLFDVLNIPAAEHLDYTENYYHGGVRISDRGRSFNTEFRGNTYSDALETNNDQTRTALRVQGILPIPKYEWITLSGGYRYFTSKYDTGGAKFTAKTAWGSGSAELNKYWSVKYAFVFDRAGSDLDPVPTDNLTNGVYLTYAKWKKATATVGYQYAINDDYSSSVRSNGFYANVGYALTPRVDFRGDFGSKAEDVRDGSRLLGDEDWARYRVSAKYRFPLNATDNGTVSARVENLHRKNDQIDTRVDFVRAAGDVNAVIHKFSVSGSYSYSTGEYDNQTQDFEFTDHLLTGDLQLPEWKHFQLGGGAVYYRSKRDLDVESFALRANGSYRFDVNYMISVKYTADNFDDLTVSDEYYTANIVEILIARDISF